MIEPPILPQVYAYWTPAGSFRVEALPGGRVRVQAPQGADPKRFSSLATSFFGWMPGRWESVQGKQGEFTLIPKAPTPQ